MVPRMSRCVFGALFAGCLTFAWLGVSARGVLAGSATATGGAEKRDRTSLLDSPAVDTNATCVGEEEGKDVFELYYGAACRDPPSKVIPDIDMGRCETECRCRGSCAAYGFGSGSAEGCALFSACDRGDLAAANATTGIKTSADVQDEPRGDAFGNATSQRSREYQAVGQECSAAGSKELLRMECPPEGCLEACGGACDGDRSCEAFVTRAEQRCVLYRRCEVAETNNLPRARNGNLVTDLVRLKVWNATVRTATAHVCTSGCPAAAPDYVVTRDFLRSCGPRSVAGSQDLSADCARGDRGCAFEACAALCRLETACVEFAVSTDLRTCELQDGSCVPALDRSAAEYRGFFRSETAAEKQRAREEAERMRDHAGDSSEDSSAAYPNGDSPSDEAGQASGAPLSTTRSYVAAGERCIASASQELSTVPCDLAACNSACQSACDREEECEAYAVGRGDGLCTLYSQCSLVDAGAGGDAQVAQQVHVCTDRCPAGTPAYYASRRRRRACGAQGVIRSRDVRICDGSRSCTLRRCASLCKAAAGCSEFVVSGELATCELTDGSCEAGPAAVDDGGPGGQEFEYIGRLGRRTLPGGAARDLSSSSSESSNGGRRRIGLRGPSDSDSATSRVRPGFRGRDVGVTAIAAPDVVAEEFADTANPDPATERAEVEERAESEAFGQESEAEAEVSTARTRAKASGGAVDDVVSDVRREAARRPTVRT